MDEVGSRNKIANARCENRKPTVKRKLRDAPYSSAHGLSIRKVLIIAGKKMPAFLHQGNALILNVVRTSFSDRSARLTLLRW